MTDILSASIATQLNRSGSLAVSRVQTATVTNKVVAATPSRSTPNTLGLSLNANLPVTLSVTQAQTATSNALDAGSQILADLQNLDSQLSTAISSGLVATDANLTTADGTRVSRLNITSDARRTLNAIDKLVQQAGVGGANLISSASGRITIQTTEFGGRVTVQSQPLDTRGLNLQGLQALTQDQAIEARTRVRAAIATATVRLNSLQGLNGSLQFLSGTTQSFLNFGNEQVFAGAVRGRLVNLSA